MCMYIHIYICIYARIYVYSYMCMFIYIYIYIHTHIRTGFVYAEQAFVRRVMVVLYHAIQGNPQK